MAWTEEKQKNAELIAGVNSTFTALREVDGFLHVIKSGLAMGKLPDTSDIMNAKRYMKESIKVFEKYVEEKL